MAQNLMDIISSYVGTSRGGYQQGIEWNITLSFAHIQILDEAEEGSDRVGEWHAITRTIHISHEGDLLLSAHKVISGEEEFDGVDSMEHESLKEKEWTIELDKTAGQFLSRLKELFSNLSNR
jgi:hypothetical protein